MNDLRAEMWGLSAGIAAQAGLWVDRAIDVAVQLVVDGDDREAVVAVAVLAHGTSQADAIDPVTAWLISDGVRVITQLLDQRGHESEPVTRAAIGDAIRQALLD